MRKNIFLAIALALLLQTAILMPAMAQGNAPLCGEPLPVSAFPRPAGDNGWGIHWAPGSAAQEAGVIAFFVAELRAMNIKWVKIINRETQLVMNPVVDALAAAGMMPVMRITVDGMSPLYPPEVTAMVRHYRARGVPYFELYNEPNLLVEWPPGADIDIGHTVDVWIPVAHAVLAGGGFPSTPALAPGGHWEDMDFLRRFLSEVRRRAENGDDLARQVLCGLPGAPGALWLGVHNYGLNHYFDYPRDPVNLNAAPVSAGEISYYGIRPELVNGLNEIRALTERPFHVGDEIIADSNGFFKFLAYAEIFNEIIGYIPPVIITEGGWILADNQDARYPPVTEKFLVNETLRGYQYMLDEAPDWLLAWQPWILCNTACNGTDLRFEAQAWYKARGQTAPDVLPVVPALKELAARTRNRTRSKLNLDGNKGLPWWVGQTKPDQVVIPGEGLRRTPLELIRDTALRLGRLVYSLWEDSDAVRMLPDPLAMSNRFILENTSSRLVELDIQGVEERLHLDPYGSAVIEIRPQITLTETQAITIETEVADRVEVVRLPTESNAEFARRQQGLGAALVTSEPAISASISNILPQTGTQKYGNAGYDVSNPHRFGVTEFRRLSCQENPGLALLFVEVVDAGGQPLDGIKLMFNTPDGQNPVLSVTGEKGPGQAEFVLIGYAEDGRREWTINVGAVAGGSPLVTGIRTDLPDDPCPNRAAELTNRFGHYSYRVRFQEGAVRGIPPQRTPLEILPVTWSYPRPRPPGTPDIPLSPRPLRDWPRPRGDNGRGLHFFPTGYWDDPQTREIFVWHMVELDLRWATIYYKDEVQLGTIGTDLKQNGIMPVFRLDVIPEQDYGGYLIERDLQVMRELGLPPYIQLYNEPTVGQEWRGDVQFDLELYRRNFIAAADRVYEAGGYIGFQDVDVASLRALLASIKAQNKLYLFNEAFFVAHCYGSNHPPAYPYDPLNQADRPGTTIYDDWQVSVLCFQKFARVWEEEVGFVPPIIVGEGGWATSILEDGRYPRVTLEDHAKWHYEIFDWFRTGRLSNGEPLPDYLFAFTPWLIWSDWQIHFDENAWFYSRLTGTKHETIEGIKRMPYFVRKFSWGYQ